MIYVTFASAVSTSDLGLTDVQTCVPMTIGAAALTTILGVLATASSKTGVLFGWTPVHWGNVATAATLWQMLAGIKALWFFDSFASASAALVTISKQGATSRVVLDMTLWSLGKGHTIFAAAMGCAICAFAAAFVASIVQHRFGKKQREGSHPTDQDYVSVQDSTTAGMAVPGIL